MAYKVVGKSVERWDAVAKVQGRAEYTGDYHMKGTLYGKICRATIAHGIVKSLDISEALKVPGVIKVLTPDDVSQCSFPTAGHPYSLDISHQDIADRNILTKRVRLYGDEIAAVVAETELAAEIAVSKIKAVYEEFPFYLTPEESLKEGAVEIHEGTKNTLAHTVAEIGNPEEEFKNSKYIIEDSYETQIVQHCHMENQVAISYKSADGRYTCVSSTQIPHICKRILGQAFGMPWSKFRVIKPFIGGGFGNKQDVTIEPLSVAMSMAVGGRPVRLELTREEVFAWTRVRHAISYKIKMGITEDGIINALDVTAVANNGAYASHGHSIAVKGAGILWTLYGLKHAKYTAHTVFTNTATAGAMRGYGVPQVIFAIESHIEKCVKELGLDPIEFRAKNFFKEGHHHPLTDIQLQTFKLEDCMRLGVERFNWHEKMKQPKQTRNSDIRRGFGMAAFSYATGVYPYSLEMAGCRLSLIQDGSVKMMVGATEIGQGADTVFAQMVAETLGIDYNNVYADQNTDTDYSPFDPAAYASRQSYVTGMAVRKAAEELKDKILQAAEVFYEIDAKKLDIVDANIVNIESNEIVDTLGELALKTYYDIPRGGCLSVEVSHNLHDNAYPCGISFAEVAVDMKTGKVEVVSMLNVHDSGTILNPLLAEGQVEGGMGMGLSYALSEVMQYDKKTGKPLNNNLLDYKMPTMMDIHELDCAFVEPHDESGPYGNKGLGEPPLCCPAGAIRNAVLDATGIYFNEMPLNPQRVYEGIAKAGVSNV